MKTRTLEHMPFDMMFDIGGGRRELCHATGIEVEFDYLPGDWWNEYVDSEGGLHYGR